MLFSSDSKTSPSTSDDDVDEEVLRNSQPGPLTDSVPPAIPGHLAQNIKSKMLHRVKAADNCIMLCGIKMSAAFKDLPAGSRFMWPRCSRCFAGELIDTVGKMVERLDELKANRASQASSSAKS